MRNRKRSVSEIMQTDVVSLRVDERLDLADDIMRLGRVRYIPVLESDRVVGIVSQRDLIAASLTKALDYEPTHRCDFLRSLTAQKVMSHPVISVGPDELLCDAAQRMIEGKIGCLPVIGPGDRLIGLVTETDLLRAAFHEAGELEGAEHHASDNAQDSGFGRGEQIKEKLDELRALRDELRVQVHLGKAEAGDLWDRLERPFAELERRAKQLMQRTEEPLHGIGSVATRLVEELHTGYRRVRELM